MQSTEERAPAPVVHIRQEGDNALVLSFYAVRQALGYLGLFLPLSLIVYSWLSGRGLERSISDFYHGAMGDVLVGTLCAIGVFLFSYQGYRKLPQERISDRWVARLAGLSVIGVALFPVPRADYPVCAGDPSVCRVFGFVGHPHYLHYGSAAIFFGCLAVFCLVLFTRGDQSEAGRMLWTPRNKLFVTCGGLIVGSMLAMLPYMLAGEASRQVWDARHYIFWCETVGVVAFAISWLVKGRAPRTLANLARSMRNLSGKSG